MFKRITSALMVLMILFATVSCGRENDIPEETTTDSVTEEVADTTVENVTASYAYKVGYVREDITPKTPIPLNSGAMLTKVQDNLYATCVAISDGEHTVLLYSLDIKNLSAAFDKTAKSRIKKESGVPSENVIINAMHNHTAPCTDEPSNSTAVRKWSNQLANTMASMAKQALEDMSDAAAYIGRGETENFTFVRRYFHEDGSFSTQVGFRKPSSSPIVRHETEADEEVQVIRFVRDGKKDVIMANWQSHIGGAISNAISGGYVQHARSEVESSDDDALFVFFLGACANLNLYTKIKELDVTDGNYIYVGKNLGKEIVRVATLENMTPIQGGKVEGSSKIYKAEQIVYTGEYLENAKAVKNSGHAEGSMGYEALLDKYGFGSNIEVNFVTYHEKAMEAKDMTLGALSLGDISFVSMPFEMFDTNGQEIKARTPDKMTFILSCSGGAYGYVPSALAVKNGGYEVYSTHFKYGTAEEVVEELLEMLRSFDNK